MSPKKALRKVAPKKFIAVAEESYRKSRVGAMHLKHGIPAKNLRVIAVTGTNGKTSTCNYLNDILKNAGYSTALFTTAVIEMVGERSINTNHTTVPKAEEFFAFLAKANSKNVDFVILEVTSHALHQHKVWGIPIEIAIMTNISQDHLDYHGTMQKYADAKARLFNSYMKPRVCILNSDDEWFDFFFGQSVGKVLTYGKSENADLCLESVTETTAGLGLRLYAKKKKLSIVAHSPCIGGFNAYNLAAASLACLELGIRPDLVRKGLESVNAVPGRMELVRANSGVTAVIDYAHAPDALEQALLALRHVSKGSIAVVFGATGDRDTGKRPLMGEVVATHADKIYLTDDETYTENPQVIRSAVMEGITRAHGKGKTQEIADRREAIKQALREAHKEDMVLIAGLGHQDYRAMNEGKIAWQETDVVRTLMKELGIL